ncbi:MAG TPA: hypothetical protein VK611_02885 [Acidimicrobiales bacterium]|nr:hypothetical protein [Acidimicrobiales bacterium]
MADDVVEDWVRLPVSVADLRSGSIACASKPDGDPLGPCSTATGG